MRTRRLRLIVLGAIALMAGATTAGAGSASTAGTEWRQLRRPLHFPELRRGDACPTSASRPFGAGSADILVGAGPVYLLVGSLVAAVGVVGVDIGKASSGEGWRGTKTPWEVDASYGGRILIRGRRIDRPGEVRFGSPPTSQGQLGRLKRELRWGAGVDHDSGARFRGLAAGSLFRSPGCYAFQADGAHFSEIVVIAVTDGARRG